MPNITLVKKDNDVHAIWIDKTAAIWHQTKNTKTIQQIPSSVTTQPSGNIAANICGGILYVFWIGTDKKVWVNYHNGQQWGAQAYSISDDIPASPNSEIAVVSRSNSEMSIFWVGNNGGIYCNAVSPLNPKGWCGAYLVPKTDTTQPNGHISASVSDRNISIFWVDNKGLIYSNYLYAEHWGNQPIPVNTEYTKANPNSGIAVTRSNLSMKVVWITENGAIYANTSSDVKWNTPFAILDMPSERVVPQSSIAMTTHGTEVSIYWKDSNNQLKTIYSYQNQWQWRGPFPIIYPPVYAKSFAANADDQANILVSMVDFYATEQVNWRILPMPSIGWKIPSHQITGINRQNWLGGGGYADAYKVKWNNKIDIVLKKPRSSQYSQQIYDAFQNEIQIMSTLNSPYVVKYYGIVEGIPCSYVMEKMSRSLDSVLYSNQPLDWQYRFQIAFDIAWGINFLHENNPPITHRDLKSLNILLDNYGRAKISDFGISKFGEQEKPEAWTKAWTAPEIIKSTVQGYPKSADVYSYAIILLEITSRVDPRLAGSWLWRLAGMRDFYYIYELSDTQKESLLANPTNDLNRMTAVPFVKNLISWSWKNNANERPSMRQILDLFIAEKVIKEPKPAPNPAPELRLLYIE